MIEVRDRRARRTRRALIDAFNQLFLERRQRQIRVSDIVTQADVGRSTFYDHYSGAEALLLDALAGPFAVLADAAAGAGDEEKVETLLRHFWDNRRRARDTLGGRTGEVALALLSDLVEQRLEGKRLRLPARLAAAQLAGAAFVPMRAWLLGQAWSTPSALAASLCRGGAELAAALLDQD